MSRPSANHLAQSHPGAAAIASTGGLCHRTSGGRDRRQSHRLDLDVDACLIGVHFQEHVADAQGRALGMGAYDFDLLHGDQYPG